MTEAVVAGAVAGAIAGAIVALAVAITSRRRDGGWRSHASRPGEWQSRGGPAQVVRMTHTYTPDHGAAPVSGFPMSDAQGRVPSGFSFDALEDSGKRVLAIAQDEAILVDHNYIGTEHLLLGLVRGDADGPAGRALVRLGITLDKARTAVRFIVGQGQAPTGPSEITMSPRTRKVLELAMDEARKLGHAQVGAAEICLGLIREGQGIASGIIESLGVTLDAARGAVLAEMSKPAPAPAPRPDRPLDPRPAQGHPVGPFDRLNDRSKRVLALAQDEAVRFNHNYIGPEHLLLGLLREGEGIAARVLVSLGFELSQTRRAVEQIVGRGESAPSREVTLIPRSKKVIELAIDEAGLLGQGTVATEHLLLGLIREGGSMACDIIKSRGVPLEKVREDVLVALGPTST